MNPTTQPESQPLTPGRWGWASCYGLAVVGVATAMGLRLVLEAWVGPGLPTFITFYPMIMVVALLAGFGPGMVATAVTVFVVGCWIMPSVREFAIASPVDRLSLAIFTCMGLFMSGVAGLYRRNRDKAAAYDRESALHENRERLATFAAATFEGIVESEAGRIVDCNEQFARMLGYPVTELKGVEITSLIPSEERDLVTENVRQGQDSNIEHQAIRKDGTRIIVETHGRSVSPGSVRRHTAVRDITDRKQVEEDLRTIHAELELRVDERTRELIEAEKRLREINESLEQRVDERTADLQAANTRLFDSRRAALNMMEDASIARRAALNIMEDAVIARRQVEESSTELLLAKEEWERTFNSVPDLIAIIDSRHYITRVNRAMAQYIGLTPEQCIGQSCFFNVHGADHLPALCPHASTMSDAQFHEAEIHEERLGVDFMVTTTPVFDECGQITGTVHVARDITQRKRSEEALRESEERLRFHMDNSPMAVIEWDKDFIVTRWTGESERMFGWSAAETVGKPIADLNMIHEEDIPIVQNTVTRLTDGVSQQVITTNRNYTKGGDIRYCTWYNSVLTDQQGRVSSVLSNVIDITNLKLAEQERQKFVSLADHSTEFIGMCDLNLVTFYVNDAGMKLVGLDSLEEALRFNVMDCLFPEDRDYIEKEFIPKVLMDGHGKVEFRFRHFKTGEPIWMIHNVFFIRDVEGHPVGLATVSRDITQRKRASDQLDLLAETASKLLVSESPQDVAASLYTKAMLVLDCDVFFNFLVDEERGRLHLNSCAGIPEEEKQKIEWLDFGVAISGCAARDACHIMVEQIPTTPDPRTELLKSYGIQAYACLPLMAQGRVLGTLGFGTRGRTRFRKDDLALMRAVADQVAIAMEKTQNAQALKKSHEELEQRVTDRTSELADVVNTLLAEIDVREKAEEALEESAKELEDLYNRAPCGYHSLDRDGTFVRVNDTELRWLGYERNEIEGKMKAMDIMTPESLAVFAKNFPRFKQGHDISDLRLGFIRKDGSILPVLLNATPIVNENGEYIMSRSTIYDITDLVQAEESVKRMNWLFRTLSETGKVISRLPDRDALFRDICRINVDYGGFLLAWVGLVDEESGEVHCVASSGKTAYLDDIRITAIQEPEGKGPAGISIRKGTYYICNDFQNDPCTRPWHERGKAHGIHASASIALKEGNHVIGALTLYTGEKDFFDQRHVALLVQMGEDVSFALDNQAREALRMKTEQTLREETLQRLQAVEALRRQEHILIQQNRQAAMGEMIGNIAHQWRQPLNTLGLFTQRLGFFYGSPSFNKEFVDTSVAKSMEIIQHMSHTIDDFRNFFSTEREKSVFGADEAVNKALSLVEASFKERGINIEKCEQMDVKIFGFPNEYAQVLLNIFINAKDVIEERNVEFPRLKITIGAENGTSVVTIADNAGGVPEDIMEKIFDPYFTTKGPQQGTGVGLFMSKSIIENNMGGRLSVRNTDVGAEFRIEV